MLESGRYILGPMATRWNSSWPTLSQPPRRRLRLGTDALHLALRAGVIGHGDEVISKPFTFIATAEAIRYVGATSVFVDIDPHTFNIDVAAIEAAITPRTRCVLPVHLFGQPADMPAIMALCEARGIRVIEDCAQSFGAAIGGRMTGSIGAFGCFSFFPSKNLGGCGDGGLVATASAEAADALRRLRNHGSQVRYHHDEIGWNSRLDEIQAAILRVKLAHLEDWTEARRAHARRYTTLLAGSPMVKVPREEAGRRHVYHIYAVRSPDREGLRHALAAEGIQTGLHYPIPVHLQKAHADLGYRAGDFPVSEAAAREVLSLPIYPEMTAAQVERVVAMTEMEAYAG